MKLIKKVMIYIIIHQKKIHFLEKINYLNDDKLSNNKEEEMNFWQKIMKSTLIF